MNFKQPVNKVPVKVEYWQDEQLDKTEKMINDIFVKLETEKLEKVVAAWVEETLKRLITSPVELFKTYIKEEENTIKEDHIFDLLGAYYYNDKHIELYSYAIALTAEFLNVRLECLTCVVLAHETVHAAIHVGGYNRRWINEFDSWEDCYKDCNSTFHEAIAQYFTEQFVNKKTSKSTRSNIAFYRLAIIQPHIYQKFIEVAHYDYKVVCEVLGYDWRYTFNWSGKTERNLDNFIGELREFRDKVLPLRKKIRDPYKLTKEEQQLMIDQNPKFIRFFYQEPDPDITVEVIRRNPELLKAKHNPYFRNLPYEIQKKLVEFDDNFVLLIQNLDQRLNNELNIVRDRTGLI